MDIFPNAQMGIVYYISLEKCYETFSNKTAFYFKLSGSTNLMKNLRTNIGRKTTLPPDRVLKIIHVYFFPHHQSRVARSKISYEMDTGKKNPRQNVRQ